MHKKESEIRWSYISQNKKILMGLFALMIVLYHFCLDCLQYSDLPLPLVVYGNSVSDAFLFLSGIGLYYSMTKNTL